MSAGGPTDRLPPGAQTAPRRGLLRPSDREILHLAVPAFGALVAQPLFLLADSVIVGRLGTPQLAGLSVASAVLLNAVFLCVFLSYGATAVVARSAGAGDMRAALLHGLDGIWLALLLGVALAVAGLPLAPMLVDLFGSSPSARPYAVSYLRISLFGLPSMLVVLAATGAMRGLKNTRTPLLVTALAMGANALLNLVLVYPAGLGVAGSALGTVMAQTGAAVWLGGLVVRSVHGVGGPLRPNPAGILAAAAAGVPLILRTALLRVALIVMTYVAASHGNEQLAAHQIAFTLWFVLTMAPEAFAISGQALVGHALGAGDTVGARAITRRAIAWGLATGMGVAVFLVALRPLYAPLFIADPAVQALLGSLVVVLAATQPVGAVLYVLDAVLIGAGDGRYLAWTMLAALLVFMALAGVVLATQAGVVALWWSLGAWLLVRHITVVLRYRSDAWLLTGAPKVRRTPAS